jgi:hypothetical protein
MSTRRILPSGLLRELRTALVLIIPIGVVLFIEITF